MDVDVDPRLVSSILAQLRTRNAAECAFHGITADYQALLRQCMELAVGVKQVYMFLSSCTCRGTTPSLPCRTPNHTQRWARR